MQSNLATNGYSYSKITPKFMRLEKLGNMPESIAGYFP